uniref:Uncharacterized protein n=1 Tax=uncultured Desulfobacterium sp. TaxID=201089 RepID=E1YBN0_9BACT|nr:unknown protein [uncultured Desulfobacterium sp.]
MKKIFGDMKQSRYQAFFHKPNLQLFCKNVTQYYNSIVKRGLELKRFKYPAVSMHFSMRLWHQGRSSAEFQTVAPRMSEMVQV